MINYPVVKFKKSFRLVFVAMFIFQWMSSAPQAMEEDEKGTPSQVTAAKMIEEAKEVVEQCKKNKPTYLDLLKKLYKLQSLQKISPELNTLLLDYWKISNCLDKIHYGSTFPDIWPHGFTYRGFSEGKDYDLSEVLIKDKNHKIFDVLDLIETQPTFIFYNVFLKTQKRLVEIHLLLHIPSAFKSEVNPAPAKLKLSEYAELLKEYLVFKKPFSKCVNKFLQNEYPKVYSILSGNTTVKLMKDIPEEIREFYFAHKKLKEAVQQEKNISELSSDEYDVLLRNPEYLKDKIRKLRLFNECNQKALQAEKERQAAERERESVTPPSPSEGQRITWEKMEQLINQELRHQGAHIQWASVSNLSNLTSQQSVHKIGKQVKSASQPRAAFQTKRSQLQEKLKKQQEAKRIAEEKREKEEAQKKMERQETKHQKAEAQKKAREEQARRKVEAEQKAREAEQKAQEEARLKEQAEKKKRREELTLQRKQAEQKEHEERQKRIEAAAVEEAKRKEEARLQENARIEARKAKMLGRNGTFTLDGK